MSRYDFSFDEFSSRRQRVRNAMQNAGLDWMVLFHPVSIHWLTGSDAKSYQEFQCLLLSAEPGPITVITREGERCEFEQDAFVDQLITFGGPEPEDPVQLFEQTVRSLGLIQARVGMEVPAYYLHPKDYVRIRDLLGKALVAEPSNLVHDLKLVKSPNELQYIREASRIADLGMSVFRQSLSESKTELEVAGDVYQCLMSSGSFLAASPMNLVSGERSCYSHGAPTDRKLRRGDYGSIEYGAVFRRYTSTIGRQFCLGTPTSRMLELYDLVRRAADAFIAAARPGIPATEPHLAAKQIIAEAGLDHGRVHTSGYGLAPGFPPTWGEPMHLFGGSQYTLAAGMVVTVEPPVFLGDEKLGARLIDNLLITEDGAELLSTFSRDLIVVD